MRKPKMLILDKIRKDEEIKKMKEQWKEIFPMENFPGFNLDFYGGIDDYKQKIRNTIESKDYSIISNAVKLIDLTH